MREIEMELWKYSYVKRKKNSRNRRLER